MNAIKHALLCGLAASAFVAVGCARAQARVVPEMPALDVPPPPPRNVEAIEPEPPQPAAEPEEPVRTPPARPRPAPAVQQRAEPPKPEPPKVDTPAPAEPLRAVDEPRAQPFGTLQTTPAGREAELEKTIHDALGRAIANLNRVNYATLNADARTQYDQARRFISQAQGALRERNLVYADNLADKADTLAAQLAGR